MSAPPKILVAHDFSPCSRVALHRALGLARALGAEVEVVHVVDEPADPRDLAGDEDLDSGVTAVCADAERMLEDLAESVDPSRETIRRVRVLRGSPAEAIVEAAREGSPEILVLGTHGRRGFTRLVVGSVAEQVARTAPCDVLVCRRPG